MLAETSPILRAITLMREAQAELDRGGHAAIAAHLETAIGFAEMQASRHAEAPLVTEAR